MFEGVRVTEPLCIKGLHPVFEGDKGDRRVTGWWQDGDKGDVASVGRHEDGPDNSQEPR